MNMRVSQHGHTENTEHTYYLGTFSQPIPDTRLHFHRNMEPEIRSSPEKQPGSAFSCMQQ